MADFSLICASMKLSKLGAKPTDWFERNEWRISARAAAHVNDAEFLELVGYCQFSIPRPLKFPIAPCGCVQGIPSAFVIRPVRFALKRNV